MVKRYCDKCKSQISENVIEKGTCEVSVEIFNSENTLFNNTVDLCNKCQQKLTDLVSDFFKPTKPKKTEKEVKK